MKRQILLTLAATLLVLPALARDFTYTYEGQTLTYTVIDEDAKTCMTKAGEDGAGPGNRISGKLIIPARALDNTIEYKVVSIGDYSFYYDNLDSVEISESVTSIGTSAFINCSALSVINLPQSILEIGDGAFSNCRSLSYVEIPKSIKKIGYNVFSYCYSLTSIVIPDSVTEIGSSAFYGCSKLSSIEIGKSVISIGNYAFYCRNITSIVLKSMTPPNCSSYYETFSSETLKNSTLYVPEKSMEAYRSAYEWKKFSNIMEYSVPNDTISELDIYYIINHSNHTATVTYAEQNSLSNYEGMQSAVIPETVEYEGESYTVTGICEEAFNNCWGLKAVTLPSTLQSIGKLAFGYCTSLRSVVIPDEVTVIDDEAFTGCSALASVIIGNKVETIGDYAFFGCTGLSSINVPESVKNIGENAFMGVHWINEVHTESKVPADTPVSAFSTNAYRNATLVVPDGALSIYKSHPTWSNFLAIREESNSTTDIMVVEGAIVVRGADSVRIYNPSGAQIYSGKSGRIELPSGIYLVVTDSVSRKVRL